jgi:hypothetical protein
MVSFSRNLECITTTIKRLLKDKELYDRVRVNTQETAKKQFNDWEKLIYILEWQVLMS